MQAQEFHVYLVLMDSGVAVCVTEPMCCLTVRVGYG